MGWKEIWDSLGGRSESMGQDLTYQAHDHIEYHLASAVVDSNVIINNLSDQFGITQELASEIYYSYINSRTS